MIYRNRRFSGASRQQRGFTLLEALVAFIILAGGLMVLFRFHTTSLQSTADSKIRAQAVSLAEAKIEEIRSYLADADVADSSTDNDEYNVRMRDGSDSFSDGFAAAFTRTWFVNTGTTPDSILVEVTWVDRTAVADGDGVFPTEIISLSSLVLGGQPDAGARILEAVLAGNANPGGTIEPTNPLDVGTYYGTGGVEVSDNYAATQPDDWDPVPPGVIYYYNITFHGSIDTDGAALLTVVLDGGTNNGPATCSISALQDPLSPTAIRYVNPNWYDNSEATGSPIVNPYTYTCTINGIPDEEEWSGIVTYAAEAVQNNICVPNEGSTTLTFSQQSPAELALGVLLIEQGLCTL